MEQKQEKARKTFGLKNFLSLLLAAVFIFVGAMFSGCAQAQEGPDLPKDFFAQYIGGVNAVYADSSSGESGNLTDEQVVIKDLTGKLIDGLLAFYGNGKDGKKEFLPFNSNAPFYDSIRMLVTPDSNDSNGMASFVAAKHWNWFIDFYKSNVEKENYKPNDEELYKDWKERVKQIFVKDTESDYSFPSYFSDILQVALYEIMLGKDNLTTLDVTSDGTSYTVKVKTSSNEDVLPGGTTLYEATNGTASSSYGYKEGEDGYVGVRALIENLQNEYKQKTRYIGLTKENSDRFISYILNEIIGEELVADDYENYGDEGNEINFRNYVSTVAYLVYSQTYNPDQLELGQEWTYNWEYEGTEISYTFSEGDRITAISSGLSSEGSLSEDNTSISTDIVGSFSAKPATYAKYFPGETFFGDPEASDQFEGRPYAEYQSLLIVPANNIITRAEGGLRLAEGFCFNFMSKNKNLKINTTIRFCAYNSAGEKFFYEFEGEQIDFSQGEQTTNANGETCFEYPAFFTISTKQLDSSLITTKKDKYGYTTKYYTIGFFAEEAEKAFENLENETRLTSTSATDLQKFYKVEDSTSGVNAHTVLNEKKAETSFFEITFDIVKSASDPVNTDYKFSAVLFSSVLYPGVL